METLLQVLKFLQLDEIMMWLIIGLVLFGGCIITKLRKVMSIISLAYENLLALIEALQIDEKHTTKKTIKDELFKVMELFPDTLLLPNPTLTWLGKIRRLIS